jgi:LacI family transcriptional regulator
MRRKIVTIRDVALLAGVSVSTVSHVLNGNAQHVGAIKRARVQQAMDELRYRPNAIARSMVKQTTATIGVIITEIDNPLFIPVIASVESVLSPAGYHMVLASARDIESEIQAIETLRSQQVDGFIFMSLSLYYPVDHLVYLRDEGVPFVLINRSVKDEQFNLINWADEQAAYDATEHLINLGHRHLGTISGPVFNDPPRRSAMERHHGWLRAQSDHGITVQPAWAIVADYTYEGGYRATQELLLAKQQMQSGPTALFVASDMMAIGTLKALHDAGMQVPRDIAVMTMGDSPFTAYTVPALSTFELPVAEAGQLAAQILLDWFTQGSPDGFQQVTLNLTKQIRESCGAKIDHTASKPPLSPH